jgi:hypothetical protein
MITAYDGFKRLQPADTFGVSVYAARDMWNAMKACVSEVLLTPIRPLRRQRFRL